jgi:hypothetical protein
MAKAHIAFGKYRNIFFSEAIALIEPKLCINHWKVLYKLCVFYVDRNSKMTTTAGHSFQQYFSNIVTISVIGGGNRSTQRNPLTCGKSDKPYHTYCCIK